MKHIIDYINWHYFEVWTKTLLLWRNITLFPFYYFSIPLHIKTLFAPWKKQLVKPGIGFHITVILYTISFNIMSRAIGAVVRTTTIIYGLALMVFFFLIFLIPSVLWIFIPFVTLPFYIGRTPKKGEEAQFFINKSKGNLKKIMMELLRHPAGIFTIRHLGLVYDETLAYFTHQKDMFDTTFHGNLTLSQLVRILCTNFPPLTTYLERNNIKSETLINTVGWYEMVSLYQPDSIIYDLQRIKKTPGIGHDWVYGYTVDFDILTTDLTKKFSSFPILVGREKEMKSLENILLQTETNNALIAGNPGTGRHMLVEALAHRINIGLCHPSLSRKRVLMLDMHAIISAGQSPMEVKGIMSQLLSEAVYGGNVIVVIDEIDKYTSSDAGRIDLSDVLSKFAKSGIATIGITTPYGYHKYIETNSSISLFFEKIELEPPAPVTALEILEVAIAPVLEKKYGITVTYEALKKTIDDADRYISATPYPAKAIELLDEACIYLINDKHLKLLNPAYIDEYLSLKLNTHIGNLQKNEKEKLLNLEDQMHKRVINQETAIRMLAAALRRNRLNISSANKPIGSFLFLGPTGVGKTETAKTLAEVYFGSDERMIRLDMSQYKGEEGLEKLIGSIKLGSPGELTSRLRDKPFSILLLDELEKSDKSIYNLFLTLLDEGYIKDHMDKTVEAKNTIIIATSNAGSEFIRERINMGIKGDTLERELIDYVQREKIFSPELLNRFDGVIVFTPLSEGHIREIARLQLEILNKRLAARNVMVDITPDLVRKLAVAGFDPQFGGRAMKRIIAEVVEDQIAQKLLSGEVKKGEKIQIEL